MGFSMGQAWLNGVSYEQSQMRSHLFLGPLRPEDFEQLAALRKAAEMADAQLSKFMRDGASVEDYPVIAALREALMDRKS